MSLWANLHASFPIALVLAGLFGLEALASAAPDERFRTGAKWALVLLAALLATGATPYGYQPLLVSLKIVGAKELDYIDEWNPIPFDFSGVYGVAFIAGSLAIVAAARAGWTRATPIALCAALMIKHVRFFPLFAIVAAAAVATPLGRRFPRFARQPFPPSKATSRAAIGNAYRRFPYGRIGPLVRSETRPLSENGAVGSARGGARLACIGTGIQ